MRTEVEALWRRPKQEGHVRRLVLTYFVSHHLDNARRTELKRHRGSEERRRRSSACTFCRTRRGRGSCGRLRGGGLDFVSHSVDLIAVAGFAVGPGRLGPGGYFVSQTVDRVGDRGAHQRCSHRRNRRPGRFGGVGGVPNRGDSVSRHSNF